MLKVYLNSEPKIVGVKFDDYKYTQVRVSAIGDVESGATVFFVPYDRDVHGDFNSDPMYKKDYDYDFNQIFKTHYAAFTCFKRFTIFSVHGTKPKEFKAYSW